MALSSLTNLGTNSPTGLSSYSPAPTGSLKSGNLEGQVGFAVVGFLTRDQNTLVFKVNTTANVLSTLSLSTDNKSIVVTDTAQGQSAASTEYYSVNMGLNTVNGGDWTLTIGTTLLDGTSASYVFVKGKPTERPRNP